jgi:hypothetical protein
MADERLDIRIDVRTVPFVLVVAVRHTWGLTGREVSTLTPEEFSLLADKDNIQRQMGAIEGGSGALTRDVTLHRCRAIVAAARERARIATP